MNTKGTIKLLVINSLTEELDKKVGNIWAPRFQCHVMLANKHVPHSVRVME